ncbi:hypothetical protein EUAN_00650 [Andreesenia angusta]|uniref:Lipopolysaccharide assembly protein A domain-containing protein n=1 Tax=Andreesenia angusta TaxID=39480 RepID=A0A1S1V9A5_9FIRM|nr:LapA family protein [Andreesenia angusta]OHW63201.1 hypothetical protein EUAN_00650 [Andreesenia angusta]
MQWKFVVSLVSALLVAVFAIQNSDPVDIKFLVAGANISQALVILISASLGAVVAIFLGLLKQFSLKKSIREKSKRIQNLESEIASLRDENRALSESLNATGTPHLALESMPGKSPESSNLEHKED